MALALVHCSIEADQGGTPHARARVSLVSWEGRSHALLFMVPSARPMAQALRLPFEYYIFIGHFDEVKRVIAKLLKLIPAKSTIFKIHYFQDPLKFVPVNVSLRVRVVDHFDYMQLNN